MACRPGCGHVLVNVLKGKLSCKVILKAGVLLRRLAGFHMFGVHIEMERLGWSLTLL